MLIFLCHCLCNFLPITLVFFRLFHFETRMPTMLFMIELIKFVIKSLILMNRLSMGSGKNTVYLVLIFWKHIVFRLSIWISSINIRQRFQCMFDNRVNIRLRSIFLWRFELLIGLCLWPVEFCLWQLAVHLLKYNVLKGWICYRTSFGWLLFIILFIKVWIVLLILISFYHS